MIMQLITLSVLFSLVLAVEDACFVASQWYGSTNKGSETSDLPILTKQMNDKITVMKIY